MDLEHFLKQSLFCDGYIIFGKQRLRLSGKQTSVGTSALDVECPITKTRERNRAKFVPASNHA